MGNLTNSPAGFCNFICKLGKLSESCQKVTRTYQANANRNVVFRNMNLLRMNVELFSNEAFLFIYRNAERKRDHFVCHRFVFLLSYQEVCLPKL